MMNKIPLEEYVYSLTLRSVGMSKTRFSIVLKVFSVMLEGSLGISASSLEDWQPPMMKL